jgi:hypothetical protein
MSLVLVSARLYTRTFITKALGLDDLLCVIALVSFFSGLFTID